VTPEVEMAEYGSLPRTERKTKRVFDTRIQDAVVEGQAGLAPGGNAH